MPRYYIDTFDGTAVFDDVGTDLTDLNAARDYVRHALTKMMDAEAGTEGSTRCVAYVRDAAGRPVLEASLVLTLESKTV